MPNEIHRTVDENGKIVVIYDDGSRETLSAKIPSKPSSRNYDEDADQAQNSGHVFKPEELEQ